MSSKPSLYIVDDNEDWRNSLHSLFGSVGLTAKTYANAREFLAAYNPSEYGCLILDLRMPGMSGLELQRELINRNDRLHIIFVSGHANVSSAVRAMRDGAIDFFEKPVDEHQLLERVQSVLRDIESRRINDADIAHLKLSLTQLTGREQEVLELLLAGSTTREIADKLNVSVRTVETYRGKILSKAGYPTMVELLLKLKEHKVPTLSQ